MNEITGTQIAQLDPHEPPPDRLRARWKHYAKADQRHVIDSGDIDDLSPTVHNPDFCPAGVISADSIREAFMNLNPNLTSQATVEGDATVYCHPLLPGVYVACCP